MCKSTRITHRIKPHKQMKTSCFSLLSQKYTGTVTYEAVQNNIQYYRAVIIHKIKKCYSHIHSSHLYSCSDLSISACLMTKAFFSQAINIRTTATVKKHTARQSRYSAQSSPSLQLCLHFSLVQPGCWIRLATVKKLVRSQSLYIKSQLAENHSIFIYINKLISPTTNNLTPITQHIPPINTKIYR